MSDQLIVVIEAVIFCMLCIGFFIAAVVYAVKESKNDLKSSKDDVIDF
jgi:hypothetical protein